MRVEGNITAALVQTSDCLVPSIGLPSVTSLASLLLFVCSFVVCSLPPAWHARLLTHLFGSRFTDKLSFTFRIHLYTNYASHHRHFDSQLTPVRLPILYRHHD